MACSDFAVVYRRIDGNVYCESTGRAPTTPCRRNFIAVNRFIADYHQRSSGKNTQYCPWGGAAKGPEVDIGATKLIARYRTLKRDLPECR